MDLISKPEPTYLCSSTVSWEPNTRPVPTSSSFQIDYMSRGSVAVFIIPGSKLGDESSVCIFWDGLSLLRLPDVAMELTCMCGGTVGGKDYLIPRSTGVSLAFESAGAGLKSL